ncbi:hypothetical protein MMPV_000876 [Pyropia vietnamensis]
MAEAAAAGATTDGWAAVTKAGAAGVVWRPGTPDEETVDPPGQGRRTYGWTAPVAGVYRLVLRASGVRRWANHDRLYPLGWRERFTTRQWRVVYQNGGNDEWSYGGKSNGGVLLTPPLEAGEAYTFSLAGRSPLAAVDAFIFFACDPAGGSCQDDSAAYASAVAAARAANPDCTPVGAGGGGAGGDGNVDGGGAVDGSGCALSGGDAAGGLVPAEAGAPPTDGWAVAAIPGGAGLIWRPEDAAGQASEPGTGRRDYVWTPPTGGGTFRLVLRAAGVRRWANHDFYVNLGEGARRVYPKGWVQLFAAPRWVHVYQNAGNNAWAYGAKSDGGILVTRALADGESLSWSLSGSSPLAAIDHFLWFRCDVRDGSCSDGSAEYMAAVAAAPAAAVGCGGRGGEGGATPIPDPAPSPTPAPRVIDATPTPTSVPSPPPPATGSACSVYAGAAGVVRMPAAATGAGGGWEVQTIAGLEALIFRPNKEATTVDPPGAAGVRTFSFKADEAGPYRVVMRMNAPHPTDYNDVWMKLGAGARKFKNGVLSSLTAGYFKVYQNQGKREWMVGGKHVDFNGHDLYTRSLAVGETFTVSLSGRSSQIAIADVLLLGCDPTLGPCGSGSPYWNRAINMEVSGCA